MSSSLTLTAVYADRLARALLAAPVLTLEDVYAHPALRGFTRPTCECIVGVLVDDGRLTDDGYGRIHVSETAAT